MISYWSSVVYVYVSSTVSEILSVIHLATIKDISPFGGKLVMQRLTLDIAVTIVQNLTTLVSVFLEIWLGR